MKKFVFMEVRFPPKMSNLETVLTPREIVEELDKYIIGQEEAKKSVAIALRNRYRRRNLRGKIKEEIFPKNIIMIGPTGVGKTEIARRLARLVNAPFVKVEATKFTEVGYVGRDVEGIVRDIVDTSVRIVKAEKMKAVELKALELAEKRLLDILVPPPGQQQKNNPFSMFFQSPLENSHISQENGDSSTGKNISEQRKVIQEKLKGGQLEDILVEVEVEDNAPPMQKVFSGLGMDEIGLNMQDLFGNLLPRQKKKKKVPLKQARKLFKQEEGEKLIDMDEVINEAVERAEQYGIVFLDEIDKITGKEITSGGPDVSREGVQRDILPIVEGSTVMTKYGPVKTDYMLFIAAGAFHFTKPSDLIPELQGRFPVRVELQSLSKENLKQILVEPENALTKQYSALLMTEGVNIEFSDDGIEEIADIAYVVNEEVENIGARRLHTIMEKLLEDISFNASDMKGQKITINQEYVRNKFKNIVKNRDLSKYIL
jgi:ATP-dependent HslUV protease ATP-binding subunit HslU